MKFAIRLTIFLLACTVTVTHGATPSAVRIQTVIQNSHEANPALGGIPTSIYYTLVDENGRPLSTISIDESSIVVALDGQPQGSITAAIPNTPLYVTMALDVSTSMQRHQKDMVAAVNAAIENAPPEARVGLLFFDHEMSPPEKFTDDQHALQDSMRRITIPERRDTCLYDAANAAILSLANQIEKTPEVRRAVILFTDGKNKPSQTAPCQYSEEDIDSIISYAQAQQTALYTISYSAEADVSLLNRLAEESGGIAFTGDGSMEEKFSEVIRSLNSQRVVHTTLFPETAGPHTLSLTLQAGNGQERVALEAGSTVIETEAAPPSSPSLRLNEHKYFPEQNEIEVSLEAFNAAEMGNVTLKLRDMETKETIGERPIRPVEGRATFHLEGLPRLIDGRQYRLEIDETQNICPTSADDNSQNPCLLPFTAHLGVIHFRFDIEPRPDERQLLINLHDIDSDVYPWVSYEISIEQAGGVVKPFSGVHGNTADPIVLSYYPQQPNRRADARATYQIEVQLRKEGAMGRVSKEIELELLSAPHLFARIGGWLNQRPFLSALFLVLLLLLPLGYLWRDRFVQRPSTFGEWVDGRGRSPLSPLTQLPEFAWTPAKNDPPPQQAPAPQKPTLRVLQSSTETAKESVTIDALPFRIGREGCHLTIGDERTSRTHATIQRIGQQYFITDMGSTNSTFLNDRDEPLAPNMRWPLNNGDRIRLGTTIELRFDLPA